MITGQYLNIAVINLIKQYVPISDLLHVYVNEDCVFCVKDPDWRAEVLGWIRNLFGPGVPISAYLSGTPLSKHWYMLKYEISTSSSFQVH